MKHHVCIFFAMLSLGYIPSIAQETHKVMSVWSNGEMRFQINSDSIDSITFSVPKPPIASTQEKILSGLFSVSPTKKVRFSSGNLQYQASTNTWRFAINQYDIVGDSIYGNVYIDSVKCDNLKASAFYEGWIDDFARFTSGFDNREEDSLAIRFHPWDRDTSAVPVGARSRYYGYGISPVVDSAYDDSLYYRPKYSNYDWGVYNPISNGGNKAGMWRTLNIHEWMYLIHERKNDGRGYAIVNGIKGLVLLPDDWMYNANNPSFVNLPDTCSENVFNTEEWKRLEESGAVFLPCDSPDRGSYHAYYDEGELDIMPTIRGTAGFVFELSEPFNLSNVRLVQDVEISKPEENNIQ